MLLKKCIFMTTQCTDSIIQEEARSTVKKAIYISVIETNIISNTLQNASLQLSLHISMIELLKLVSEWNHCGKQRHWPDPNYLKAKYVILLFWQLWYDMKDMAGTMFYKTFSDRWINTWICIASYTRVKSTIYIFFIRKEFT